ncbi:MAG: GDSL-type esterase/lipase family protein [Pirellulaceae bacterium]
MCDPGSTDEGDNDIHGGATPEQVRDLFLAVVQRVHRELPDTRIYLLSIKLSASRRQDWPRMKDANRLLADVVERGSNLVYVDVTSVLADGEGQVRSELLEDDQLHLNRDGYRAWRDVLQPILLEAETRFEQPGTK